MTRGIVVVAWGLALAAVLNAAEAGLDSPRYAPGTTAVVRFESRDLARDLSLEGLGQKPGFAVDDALPFKAWALIAVPLETPAGTQTLTLRWQEGRVLERRLLDLTVVEATAPAPKEHIVIKGLKSKVQALPKERRILAKVFAKTSLQPVWEGMLEMPVQAPVSAPFGTGRRYGSNTNSGTHRGLDLAAPLGEKVRSSNAGKVGLARKLKAHGGAVVVDHGMGLQTCYFHLSRILVREGQSVDKNTILGEVGSTGISTGPHLHWQVMLNGHAVDPLQWVAEESLQPIRAMTQARQAARASVQ
jgi:murein DD-endopeptidase MepM/ murein hydrolase activator NlpD